MIISERVKVHNDVLAMKEDIIARVLLNLGKARNELTEGQWLAVEKRAFTLAKIEYDNRKKKEDIDKASGNSLAIQVLESLDNEFKNNQGIMRYITEMIAPKGTKVYKRNVSEVTTVQNVENDPAIMAAFDLIDLSEITVESHSKSENFTEDTLTEILEVIPSLETIVKSKGEDVRKLAIKALASKCNLTVMVK